MSSKLPLQQELKPDRCAAWKEQTDGRNMLELAQQVAAKHVKTDDVQKMSQRYTSYRRTVSPTFPHLEACVEVESLLELAKGQIYRAITQTEQDLRKELEQRFGELPLRFDADNKLQYNAAGSTPEIEVAEGMTLEQFDYILNRRNIGSNDLAEAIGRDDVKWQRIATLRRKAREGNKEPLPTDIADALVQGLNKLADTHQVVPSASQETVPSVPPTKTERREVASDALRIVGLGGLEISIATRLNLQDLRLEDGKGNILVKDKTLFIPPIPLTAQQQEALRRWIAETVASKMV
jgi:hypothetical protein